MKGQNIKTKLFTPQEVIQLCLESAVDYYIHVRDVEKADEATQEFVLTVGNNFANMLEKNLKKLCGEEKE